jgi:hypothetical protein
MLSQESPEMIMNDFQRIGDHLSFVEPSILHELSTLSIQDFSHPTLQIQYHKPSQIFGTIYGANQIYRLLIQGRAITVRLPMMGSAGMC